MSYLRCGAGEPCRKGLGDSFFWMTPRGYELVYKNRLVRALTAGVPIDKYSNIAVMAKEAKVGETACLRR